MLAKKYRVVEACASGFREDPCPNEARTTSIGRDASLPAPRRTCTLHATGPSVSDDKVADLLQATVRLLDALDALDAQGLQAGYVTADLCQTIRGIIGVRTCPNDECQIRSRCVGGPGCTGQHPKWAPTTERPLNIK